MEEPLRDFRAELDRIVRFLNSGGDQAVNLWNVLSALRGPDEGSNDPDDYLKRSTTCVIRHAIGLKNNVLPAYIDFDHPDSVARRTNLYTKHNHFLLHARWAFTALDLKWNELNF